MKWWYETEIVDCETGETLTKNQWKNGNYRTIKNEKTTIIKDKNNGIIRTLRIVREHEQTRLFN